MPATILRIIALILLTTVSASANTGIPMLAIAWPAAWLLLLIVIPVEALVAMRVLALSFRNAIVISAKANIRSTLVGIPLAWVILLAIQVAASVLLLPFLIIVPRNWDPPNVVILVFGVLGSAWVVPKDSTTWQVPLAAAVLCIPSYIISVKSEFKCARGTFEESRWPEVQRWATIANRISYGMILFGLAVMTVLTLSSHKTG